MSDHRGSFVWYELMTSDAAAAADFYGKVVGWTAKDAGYPDMTYTLLHAGETQVAGLMTLPEDAAAAGARPGWLGYVAVEDVDAYAAKVVDKGGKIHMPPTDIPGIGRFCMVADPQGAAIYLFKGMPGGEPPPAMPEVPGFVAWRELMAVDGQAALDFYSDLFGWTHTRTHDMGAMGGYLLFASAGVEIGGMMDKPPQIPVPFWSYYFRVDSVDAAIARLEANGGTLLNGPNEVPGGTWVLQAMDPQGAVFALLSPTR